MDTATKLREDQLHQKSIEIELVEDMMKTTEQLIALSNASRYGFLNYIFGMAYLELSNIHKNAGTEDTSSILK